MTDADEELKFVPHDYESLDKFVSRQICRAIVEESLAKALISHMEYQTQSAYLEKMLQQMTRAFCYQSTEVMGNVRVGDGTIGEVITRWMGLGLLKELPVIDEQALGVPGIKSENANIDVIVNVHRPSSNGEVKLVQAHWEFAATPQALQERIAEVRSEQEMWWKKDTELKYM
jgi:hypothetical protein